jgi:ATP-dependent DNA ligase
MRAKKKVTEGAVPAEKLKAPFPRIALPIKPPYPPMEAKSVKEIPKDAGWLYEPKWDGFRCLVFRKGEQVLLQSKAGQPLGRYFPEMVEAFRDVPAKEFVLDGEIIVEVDGHLSFDALLQRIHPAESRIKRLASETPSSFLAFDLLMDEKGKLLTKDSLRSRRESLERFARQFKKAEDIRLSPATQSLREAERWMSDYGELGCDGVIAKRLEEPYHSGDRDAMVKIKRMRTADCVVGGFRYAQKGGEVGSLLLGLFDEEGKLNHVGFSSSFALGERKELKKILLPLEGAPGFTGSAPGGPSRWATERSTEWQPLKHKLVCEVRYDHFSGGRFRHGTKFLRWRPDKAPRQCTYDQLQVLRTAA